MKINIAHSRPTISSQDAKAVSQTIKSGHLSKGKKTEEFEHRIAKYQNLKNAAATSSGTSALHLSLLALNIKKGDYVMIPSFVCTALLNAIKYVGAKAQLVDINEDDFNISVEDAKRGVSKKTKVIIVPHMFGAPADLKELRSLNIPLIEDCAQSLGARYRGKPVGSYGFLSVNSFYATKMMTTGEGGMVCSNNAQLISQIKDLREYDKRNDYKIRFNYKLSEFQAAMGIQQFKRLPQWIKARKRIAQKFHTAFSDSPFILPNKKPGRDHIYYRYVIKVKGSRDKFIKRLSSKGVHCARPYGKALHEYLHLRGFPHTKSVLKEAVSIPIYPSLTNKEITHIIKSVLSLA